MIRPRVTVLWERDKLFISLSFKQSIYACSSQTQSTLEIYSQTDPFEAHKFLRNDDKNLDKKAEDALKQWYATDYVFLDFPKQIKL